MPGSSGSAPEQPLAVAQPGVQWLVGWEGKGLLVFGCGWRRWKARRSLPVHLVPFFWSWVLFKGRCRRKPHLGTDP